MFFCWNGRAPSWLPVVVKASEIGFVVAACLRRRPFLSVLFVRVRVRVYSRQLCATEPPWRPILLMPRDMIRFRPNSIDR
eukprot:scaffold166914_cov38-Prasinocladus_malaysianus.AAC.1